MMKSFRRVAALALAMALSFGSMTSYAGWQQNETGWWYQNDDQSYISNGWSQINGQWYLFDSSGYMLTGWQNVNGTWYYMNGSGAMLTGWQNINGTWYYMNGSGAMLTGWQDIGGTWYYFETSGAMVTGDRYIDGKNYNFASSGAMQEQTYIREPQQNSTPAPTPVPDSADTVYWGVTGKKYHRDPYCRSFHGNHAANSGTIEEAIRAGRTGWCKICSN